MVVQCIKCVLSLLNTKMKPDFCFLKMMLETHAQMKHLECTVRISLFCLMLPSPSLLHKHIGILKEPRFVFLIPSNDRKLQQNQQNVDLFIYFQVIWLSRQTVVQTFQQKSSPGVGSVGEKIQQMSFFWSHLVLVHSLMFTLFNKRSLQ